MQPAPNIKDTIRYSLYAKVEGSSNSARLVWSSFKGMPRITVFTGIEGDTDKGVISIPVSYETMVLLLNAIEKHSKEASPGEKQKVQVHLNIKDTDGVPIRTHVGDIYFGKNEEGVTWISIIKQGRPKIVFEFTSSPNIEFFDNAGNLLSKAALSTAYVKGAVDYLKVFYDRITPDSKINLSSAPVVPSVGVASTSTAEFGDVEF